MTKEIYPGQAALDAYARKVMSDGKWRVANDLVTRAADDGMVVTPMSAGRVLGRLTRDGYLRKESVRGDNAWVLA